MIYLETVHAPFHSQSFRNTQGGDCGTAIINTHRKRGGGMGEQPSYILTIETIAVGKFLCCWSLVHLRLLFFQAVLKVLEWIIVPKELIGIFENGPSTVIAKELLPFLTAVFLFPIWILLFPPLSSRQPFLPGGRLILSCISLDFQLFGFLCHQISSFVDLCCAFLSSSSCTLAFILWPFSSLCQQNHAFQIWWPHNVAVHFSPFTSVSLSQ